MGVPWKRHSITPEATRADSSDPVWPRDFKPVPSKLGAKTQGLFCILHGDCVLWDKYVLRKAAGCRCYLALYSKLNQGLDESASKRRRLEVCKLWEACLTLTPFQKDPE